MSHNRLTELGLKHGTDKATYHGFTEFYHELLQGREIKSMIEVGVLFGASLKMWREYFPEVLILGLDIDLSKSIVINYKCHMVEVDCSNHEALNDLMQDFKKNLEACSTPMLKHKLEFELIIDDGGHTMKQQQVTFDCLWPFVAPGGIYIIEDIHTSRRPVYMDEDDKITTEQWVKQNFKGSNYARDISAQVKEVIWWARHPSIENDSRTVAIIKK